MAYFFTKQFIIKEYSDTVAGMLATGWTIFTPTMGGSQGEEAHIDLINQEHTVVARVLLCKDSSWGDGSDHKYVITVHYYTEPQEVYAESWEQVIDGDYCTLWNERGIEAVKLVFYAMPQGNGRCWNYTTDASVPAQAKERRAYKYHNGLYWHTRAGEPTAAQFNVDRLVKFVRKHGGRGYGNCRPDEIKGVRKYMRNGVVRYVIDFNGSKRQLAF